MNIKSDTSNLKQPEDSEGIEDYEKLDKTELKKKAIKEFNISEDDWKDKVEVEPMFSKDTVDDISNLEKYFSERLENKLLGKILIRTGKGEEKWIQHQKAMAGSLVIKSCIGIIETFANKPMLISSVKEEDFNMQFEDAFKKVSDLIVMPHSYVDVNSHRTILKQFKDTFWNLGAILGKKTGRNMEAYFASLNNANDKAEENLRSRYSE